MKKIYAFFLLGNLFFVIFSQDFKQTEAYIQATTLSDEVITLQTEGHYDTSLEKSPVAKEAIDKAILESLHYLYNSKTSQSKENATKQLELAKKTIATPDAQTKAKIDEAGKLIVQAEERQKDAALLTDPEIIESEGYAPAIELFNQAEQLALNVNEAYLAQERSVNGALISEAKKRQADLTAKKILTKNDANDKNVSTSLADADKSLISDDFATVKSKVKTAQDILAQAEKKYADDQTKTKKQLDDAVAKFNQLKSTKVIAANSGDEKNITKLLDDGNTAFKASDFIKTQQQINSAITAMSSAETAFKNEQTDTAKLLTEATTRQKKLSTEKVLQAKSPEENAIIQLITEAQKFHKENNFSAAKDSIAKAQSQMDSATEAQGAEKLAVQSLIEQASSKHGQFIENASLIKDAENELAIANLITSAKQNLETDLPKSRKDAEDALVLLNVLDEMLAKEAALQLLAQAKNDLRVLNDLNTPPAEDPSIVSIEGDIGEAETNAVEEKYIQTKTFSQSAIDKINAYDAQTGGKLAESKKLTLPNGTIVSIENAKTNVDTNGRETILPQYYTVVAREPITITDCFWRISAFDFIYGDPLLWTNLYEANREILAERENPDLILPGQVLIIPSVRGEQREGAYDPAKIYVPFTEITQ